MSSSRLEDYNRLKKGCRKLLALALRPAECNASTFTSTATVLKILGVTLAAFFRLLLLFDGVRLR